MIRAGFAQRLSQVLSRRGAISDFASAIGISRPALQNYKSGKRLPSIDRAVAIADHAGVSVEWLVAGRGPMERHRHTDPTGAPIDMEIAGQIRVLIDSGHLDAVLFRRFGIRPRDAV